MAYNYNYNKNPYPQQNGSQIAGGYPQYYAPMYPPQAAFNPVQYQPYQPGYGSDIGGQVPQYQQQNYGSALPNKMPNHVPRPTGMNQSPKTNSKYPQDTLVVFPAFVTRGVPATWEFRRKKRMAAINNIYENSRKRIYVTPKSYKRRKMNIKDASTGAKICKIQLKISSHRLVEVKDPAGNLLFVTRCKKVLQFKKRYEVFLAKGTRDYKNREPDLLVEGSVKKAKKFYVKTPRGMTLASLQKFKKKGMERLKGKVSYEMHIQPDTDCLLMAILLLIQDELFDKTTESSGGGGGFGFEFGGGGDCGGGGGDCGGGGGGCDGGGC